MELAATKAASAEDSFRSSLEDLVTVAKRLAPYCHSLEHLVQIASLGLENDAQLQFLLNLMASPTAKR